jgi:hypothetical protein
MTRSAPVSRLAPEFDGFLFAPIGDDGKGMPLSVLSALARLDLDPWQEAADLARLPGNTATQRLASLIAALPSRPSAHDDLGAIAARLIALLPGRVGNQNSANRKTPPSAGIPTNIPVIRQVIFYVILMAVVLGARSLIASHQPVPQARPDLSSVSGTVSPRIPPPILAVHEAVESDNGRDR